MQIDSMMMGRPPQALPAGEDATGVRRGAHVDGAHICAQFVAGVSKSTDQTWAWNNLASMYCTACGHPAEDHVALPRLVDKTARKAAAPQAPARPPEHAQLVEALLPVLLALGQAHGVATDGAGAAALRERLTAMDTMALRTTAESFLNLKAQHGVPGAAPVSAGLLSHVSADAPAAGAPRGELLDESNDPLAAAAAAAAVAPAPPAPAPPAPPPPADATWSQVGALMEQVAADEKTRLEAIGALELLQAQGKLPAGGDALLDQLLHLGAREAPPAAAPPVDENERFKLEVESMVRSMNAPPPPPAPTAAAAAPPTEELLPFLQRLGLAEHAPAFAAESVDLATLADVARCQGRSELESVLKELGVKHMGQRLKIVNALLAPQ